MPRPYCSLLWTSLVCKVKYYICKKGWWIVLFILGKIKYCALLIYSSQKSTNIIQKQIEVAAQLI